MLYVITVGPFILYEYCANGQLNEYLAGLQNEFNMEVMEKLLRFGVGVVRGMDYLASKNVRLCNTDSTFNYITMHHVGMFPDSCPHEP